MRVGVAYPHDIRSKYAWAADALASLGHDVVRIDSVDSFRSESDLCDLIIVAHKGAGMNKTSLTAAIRDARCTVVQWWFDLIMLNDKRPLAEQQIIKSFGDQLRACDVVFVKEADHLDEYTALDINAQWLDQACPSDLAACEHRDSPQFDLLVYGTAGNSYGKRVDVVRTLASRGHKVAWASRSEMPQHANITPLSFVAPHDLPMLASDARFTVCIDYTHKIEGYWSDRVWLAMGMGACVAHRSTDGFNAPEATHIDFECHVRLDVELKRLRADTAGRRAIGNAAREHVMRHHTYEARCQEIIERCRLTAAA